TGGCGDSSPSAPAAGGVRDGRALAAVRAQGRHHFRLGAFAQVLLDLAPVAAVAADALAPGADGQEAAERLPARDRVGEAPLEHALHAQVMAYPQAVGAEAQGHDGTGREHREAGRLAPARQPSYRECRAGLV